MASVTTYRFEHTLDDRTYHIDVVAVSPGRWRAQMARRAGIRTALMPFYGTTPQEAAAALIRWLVVASPGQSGAASA
jgi:hypothetical protein